MFINIHVYLFSILWTFFQTCSVKRFFCYLGLLILEGCLLQNPSHAGRRRPRGRCQHLGVGSARAHKELAAFTAHHVRPPDHMSNDLRITPATIQTSGHDPDVRIMAGRSRQNLRRYPYIYIYLYMYTQIFIHTYICIYIHILIFSYIYIFFNIFIYIYIHFNIFTDII